MLQTPINKHDLVLPSIPDVRDPSSSEGAQQTLVDDT